VLSALFDMPTGAVTVWTMAAVCTVAGFWIGHRQNKFAASQD
jgi:hypothetical protein